MWKDKFSEVIVQRGYFYHVDEKVEIQSVDDRHIKAYVEGSFKYEVNIYRYDHYIVHMDCTCPYAKQGHNCKHMAATLFTYEDHKAPVEHDLTGLMDQASDDEVRHFLSLLLVNNDVLIEEFNRYLNYSLSADEFEYFKALIYKMSNHYEMHALENSALSLKYYLDELHDFIDTIIAEMLLHHYSQETFDLVSLIFLNVIEKEDHYDSIEEFVEKLVPVWMLIYAQATRQLKREMYFWFNANTKTEYPERVKIIFRQMKDITYNDI